MKTFENHPSFGALELNYYNGGSKNLFGQKKTSSRAVYIRFQSASYYTRDFGFDKLKLFGDKTLAEVNMTSEQWSSLLLNRDNENGVPVTIVYDENGSIDYRTYDTIEDDNLFKEVSQKFNQKFSALYDIKKEIKTLLEKPKLLKKDKDEILEKFNIVKETILKEYPQIKNDVFNFIQEVENKAEENFVKAIKENLFGLTELKLLEDKNKKVIKERYQGILVLKTVKGVKGTLVKDFNADNGVTFTLYRAVVEESNGIKQIKKTDEILIDLTMSSSQFSTFLTSFGSGYTNVCTYKSKFGVEVEEFTENINDEMATVLELERFVNEIPSEIEKETEEISELLSKNISKERKKELNFVFEKMNRLIGTNFLFYVEQVFDSGLKFSLKRQEDVQSGMLNGIYKKGLVEFRKDIKSLGGEYSNELLDFIKEDK